MKMRCLTAFILLAFPTVFSKTDYCNLPSCPNRSHTLCKFPEFRANKRCGSPVISILSTLEKYEIYDAHVRIMQLARSQRRQLLGRNPYHPDAKSTLEWNDELRKMAQRWANQCIMRTDQCRNLEQYSVDQRFGVSQMVNGSLHPSLAGWVKNWYYEDPLSTHNSKTLKDLSSTRSLWETASQLGCGATKTYNTDRFQVLLVCNYAPIEYNVTFDLNY